MFQDKNFTEAIKYYTIIYEAKGKQTEPYVLAGLAVSYSMNGQNREAINALHNALRICQENPKYENDFYDIYTLLATCHELLNEYEESITNLKLSAKYALDEKSLSSTYMQVAMKTNDYDEAIEYFDMAIDIYKSLARRNMLDSKDKYQFSTAYISKSRLQINKERYQEAYETLTDMQDVLGLFESEDFFNQHAKLLAIGLEICYRKLGVKH